MTIDEIRRMSRRAYVNKAEDWTKVIFGKDEYQIVFKGKNGIEAKKAIAQGNFNVKDVAPAIVCDTVLSIRQELKRLDGELTDMYLNARKLDGFIMYDKDVITKTNNIAYQITNILTYGI